jgi:beta-galactosidase
LKDVSGLSHLKVQLLDPNNYSVCDTTLYYKAPASPAIISAAGIRTRQNDTATNSGAIRVIFDRKDEFTRYKVKYGTSALTQETLTTLSSHIDVSKLPFNATYRVAVVAVNAAGVGAIGEVKSVLVGTDYAPPLVYYSEPADKGFYVGYTTELDDYAFRLQYTTTKSDYSKAITIQTSTKGVLFVPGLVNGKAYYFRMSRIKDNSYVTSWSEEHRVIPDGQQMPEKPALQGVLRNNTEALVIFEPVKKAIGYIIQYRIKSAMEWKPVRINVAQIRHARITGLQKRNVYEFRIAAINSNGESEFTEAVLR